MVSGWFTLFASNIYSVYKLFNEKFHYMKQNNF
jgi:hypothetical protein